MLVFTGQARSPAVSSHQSHALDVAKITLLMYYHKKKKKKKIIYIYIYIYIRDKISFMAEQNNKKHTSWPTDAYLAS